VTTKSQKGFIMENDTPFGAGIREVLIEETSNAQSLSEMEDKVRRLMLWLGNVVLHLWLNWLEGRHTAREVECECGGKTRYVRHRNAQLNTLFGVVRYRRAYHVCQSCQRGIFPLDERLGLRPNAMSAEVERLAGMTGVQMPFGKGREVFEELTLVSLSDQSLDKATQAYGQEVGQQEAEWRCLADDPDELLRRQREQKAPLRLYGTVDGGMVPTRGPKGEPQPWRELKVGAWFVARGHPPRHPDDEWKIRAEHITYYADILPAEDFGPLLWATGVQRHAQLACELIFLGDGARWIWDLVDFYFPDAIQIVDWFHACEYLAPVAQVAFTKQEKRDNWVEQMKTALWKGKLDVVIAACQKHINPNREDDPAHKAVTYYANNRHRMDYPTYRANGYQIGSGTVESAVKQIAQQRMKVPGARWNLESARLVSKARAAFLSGQWPELAARRQRLSPAA
jgi:hypothetical protein